jgi:hypothetical protein
MFSPTVQLRTPVRYPVRRMRSTKLAPLRELWEKKRWRAIARE